jgi:hypothetical protein
MIRPNAPAIYPCPFGATVVPTEPFRTIPAITDPMGKHWRQPDMSAVNIAREKVELTQREFDTLAEYSTSYPSGVYIGKCWKAEEFEQTPKGFRPSGIWYLVWYGPHADPKKCSINRRLITFINERKAA